MTTQINPMEEMVIELSEVFVELVNEALEEMAPYRPWFYKELSADEKLWRYEEVRDIIVPWLVEVGIYMGFQTWEEVLKNLEKIWMTNTLVDVVPPEVIDLLPPELVELVQAGPYDAAKHIREMERLFERRKMVTAAMGELPPLPETVEEP